MPDTASHNPAMLRVSGPCQQWIALQWDTQPDPAGV